MFSYFREIKDIRAFRLLDGNTTVYIRQNKQLVFNKFVKAEWETKSFDIPSDYNFHRVYKYDTYSYILVDQENKGYLFSFITDTINKLSFEYYFYDEESQRGIISTVTSYNPYSCRNETFDLRQNKILWGLDNSFVIMPLSNLFFEKKTKNFVSFLDSETGIPLWTFTLPSKIGRWYSPPDKEWKNGEIWHFVGVVNEVLWVDITKGVLLGIDITTGKTKHLLQTPLQMTKNGGYNYWELPHYAHTVYDASSHKLIGLFSHRYWEVDLSEPNPELKMWVLEKEFNKHQLDFRNSDRRCMDSNHIYFVNSHLPQIGVLNRHTLQLDWVYNFENNGQVLMQIDVTEKNLFVLDNQGTLHIFEREEDNLSLTNKT